MIRAQAGSAISLTVLDVAYGQDFNTLASSGTSTVLPTGWEFLENGTNANTTYTAGTGSSNTGDPTALARRGAASARWGASRAAA